MENIITKEIQWHKFLFRKELRIMDRQKLFNVEEKPNGTYDGIELISVTFACYCLEINWEKYDYDKSYNRIKELTDLDLFLAIDNAFKEIAEDQTKELAKKKESENMNTKSSTK
jgi:TRAP-type uncharacterized transport system substrate-binding protein